MFEITLKFLEAVRLNNSTEWLHTHWDLYQQEKKRFMQFIDTFLREAKKLNPLLEDLELKECLYRFNKDLRFSRDGKPYKENFWAIVAYGGKKSDFPCFYFHLEPGKSAFYGGVYLPNPKHETQIRTHLLKNFHRWEALISAPKFKKYYGEPSAEHYYKSTYKLKQLLKTNPDLLQQISPSLKNYALENYAQASALVQFPSDAEKVLSQLAYFRDWLFSHPLKDKELLWNDLLSEMLKAYKKILPLLNFLQEAYE